VPPIGIVLSRIQLLFKETLDWITLALYQRSPINMERTSTGTNYCKYCDLNPFPCELALYRHYEEAHSEKVCFVCLKCSNYLQWAYDTVDEVLLHLEAMHGTIFN
jgi:hypothetical protein